ncbi:hypothetical protein D1816_22625 [Aquimarina sp. AD10]|uniref:Uncharacterized protein n=1 Tax=Aquimarina aggregata TaxID=1642818 RepID=A0A162CQF8_9FLAO|nr:MULTISPECIES: hypothetical protein [Aquimarina]AXT63018.1 hypothetical protein D1816_22625 [Aquimarina sp. AD10]KZS40644.1 hypothetical protein AWE51_06755 [Aquimarina aggregata]RKM96819.1 hypothetical protein D7033_15000 [Aquimarina sp. AD10]
MFGQEKGAQKDQNPTIKIFQKEEIDYIKKWMENFILDKEMTPEINERFKIVTSYYGLKMKLLGENTKLTKIEIIGKFNILIKEQNNDLKEMLPAEQFESFSKLYDKISWSVNKRLHQL